MTDHQPPVFGSRPYDTTPAPTSVHGGQPPTHTGSGTGGSSTGTLLGLAGAGIALVTVAASYVVVRWVEDGFVIFPVLAGVAVVALAVLALLAGRHNALAPFVAIALTLPFFSLLAAGFGAGQRIGDAFEDFASSDGDSSSSLFSDEDSDDDSEAGAEGAVPLGEEGTSGNFTVVVEGIECSDTLTDAERNPDWDYTDESQEYIDVEAPEGKQFCVVSSTWANDSKEPDMVWGAFAKVVASDGTQYAPTDDDSSYGMRLDEQAGNEGGNLNPGDRAEVHSVFTLPEDVEVTHAISEGLGFDVSAVWFATS